MHTVLVLGGYGFFGMRISSALVGSAHVRLLIAVRDGFRARAVATVLNLFPEQGLSMDARLPGFQSRVLDLSVDTVIHTACPFSRAGLRSGASGRFGRRELYRSG